MSNHTTYRTVRKPYTYLINNREGFISISKIGDLITINLLPHENFNLQKELYEPIDYNEFNQLWDVFGSKAFDIHEATKKLISDFESRVKAAREIL